MTHQDIERIFEGLPPQSVITDESVFAGRLIDQRARYKGNALALLRPSSTEEVSRMVALANEANLPITVQGGNTGLCGAATPFGGVIMTLERMNRLVEFDPLDSCMVVEAGMTLAQAQEEAEKRGYFFPLRIASEHSCTIGGNVACDAGGLNVLKYGTMASLVMGLEVVLPDGRIVNRVAPLHKNTTGYKLEKLFSGSEGTLGVITKATLRLFPKIAETLTFWVDVDSFDEALRLFEILKRSYGNELQSFELMSRRCKEICLDYKPSSFEIDYGAPWSLLCEIGLTESAGEHPASGEGEAGQAEAGIAHSQRYEDLKNDLAALFAESGFESAYLAQNDRQRAAMWEIRENVSQAEKKIGYSIHHDIALPIKNLASFYKDSEKKLLERFKDADICLFGHLGDGSLHYNLFLTDTLDLSVYDREHEVNETLYSCLIEHDGTIAAEHGIGILKKNMLGLMRTPEELEIMKEIKKRFDPKGIMNPGKVLPD